MGAGRGQRNARGGLWLIMSRSWEIRLRARIALSRCYCCHPILNNCTRWYSRNLAPVKGASLWKGSCRRSKLAARGCRRRIFCDCRGPRSCLSTGSGDRIYRYTCHKCSNVDCQLCRLSRNSGTRHSGPSFQLVFRIAGSEHSLYSLDWKRPLYYNRSWWWQTRC